MVNEYYFQQIITRLDAIHMHIILKEAHDVGILDDKFYKEIVEKSYRRRMAIYGCAVEDGE